MTPFVKNGLILIGLIILGGLGYYLFVLRADSELVSSTTNTGAARLASERFVQELNAIKVVELDDSLFADPRFRSFQNYSKPLIPQPTGRANPFTPNR